MPTSLRPLILSTTFVSLEALAQAAPPPSPPSPPPAAPPARLGEVVVTGNPLGRAEAAAPVSVLGGDALVIQRAATLGDTLNGLPGVATTFFGPNAARPIIRGLDGDRIRILNNQGAAFDASSLSFDHNPSIDPLAIERIEVLRGPAAMLYGGAAIGGVVNLIDNRVPKYAIDGAAGALELRAGGSERERGASALLEAGSGRFALHADGFRRDTDDYRVPGGPAPRVANSASKSEGGALGAAFTHDDGYLGAARAEYRTRYGVVAEPDVVIDMRQTRDTIEGEWRRASGPIAGVTLRGGRTDYRHTEFEGPDPGTVFTNRGNDLRIELRHAPLGPFTGLVGVQRERFRFAALGEEAFVPATSTENQALFALEEWKSGPWAFSLGARRETARVESAGEADTGIARFGAPATRRARLTSVSGSAHLEVGPAWHLTANAALSRRAAAFYELFADGPHLATAAYEVGDRGLAPERSRALDVAAEWKPADGRRVRVGAFVNRFDNFIALRRTGVDRDAEGHAGVTDCGDGTSLESGCTADVLPEFRYQGVGARLAGIEAETEWKLADAWTLDAKLDYTRAQDLTHGEPLPRIAPLRLRLAGVYTRGPWSARIEADHSARQDRVPAADAFGGTPSYTLLHAALSWSGKAGRLDTLVYLKAGNLTDRRAFNASSIDTIRGLAPLPGRSLRAGVRVSF